MVNQFNKCCDFVCTFVVVGKSTT